MDEAKRSFAPVVDAQVRVLVLGSLPGERSLAQQRYYGHPQNQFWRLMSDVLGTDLVGLDYDDRLRALLAHHVGLWDSIAEARREGSLDSRIRGHVGNDLQGLVASLPQLRAVAFNGGTSAKIGLKALGPQAERLRTIALPSSSPAYVRPYAEKLERWSALRQVLAQP
ncbi:MAG TPA: DNA-deoxyinosine glycosylase [Burkholderiaceae bacterium]